MTDPTATTGTIDVPGACLYYERRGSGPLLLMIGSPMDSTGFTGLAGALATDHTAVTYDPRGIGNSTRADTTADITPELQADDVNHLIEALGGGPVDFFGSSGGAVVGLALVTARPELVRTLVAHEPPVIGVLPDRDEVRAQIEEIYQAYRTEGPDAAMQKFLGHVGLGRPGGPADPRGDEPPAWQPSPEQAARMRATNEVFFGHLIRQTTGFEPDIEALRAAPTRIVVAGGTTSKGQLAQRCAVAFADRLGTSVVDFPGDHGGFLAHPGEFGELLRRVLVADA